MARVKAEDFTDTQLLDFIEAQGNGSHWEFGVGWFAGVGAFLRNTMTLDTELSGRTARMAIAKAIQRNRRVPLGKVFYARRKTRKKSTA